MPKRFLKSEATKAEILDRQGNRCVYCDCELNVLNPPRYDHFVPFAWCLTTTPENMVAACSKCNGRKHSKLFKSIEEVREHFKRRKSGPTKVHSETYYARTKEKFLEKRRAADKAKRVERSERLKRAAERLKALRQPKMSHPNNQKARSGQPRAK